MDKLNTGFFKNLAYEAGDLLVKGFKGNSVIPCEWKDDETPVTETDKAINRLVIERIREEFPFISIIGEEESSALNSDWVAYCDPVDGTYPFIAGLALPTICLSILYKGIPMFSIIYDPLSKRMYHAEKGCGAFLGETPIKVSTKAKINARTNIHLIWWKKAQFDFGPACLQLAKRDAAWFNLNTIGIIGGLIASGHFDASIFAGNSVLETAAMGLIVEEAGGKCTDIHGGKINYLDSCGMKGHIITNGLLHQEVVNLMKYL